MKQRTFECYCEAGSRWLCSEDYEHHWQCVTSKGLFVKCFCKPFYMCFKYVFPRLEETCVQVQGYVTIRCLLYIYTWLTGKKVLCASFETLTFYIVLTEKAVTEDTKITKNRINFICVSFICIIICPTNIYLLYSMNTEKNVCYINDPWEWQCAVLSVHVHMNNNSGGRQNIFPPIVSGP